MSKILVKHNTHIGCSTLIGLENDFLDAILLDISKKINITNEISNYFWILYLKDALNLVWNVVK